MANRNGRFDIVILENINGQLRDGPRSFAGVEIKSINPSWKSINEDVSRLYASLIDVDEVGPNSISYGYIVFVKRFTTSSGRFEHATYARSVTKLKKDLNRYIGESYAEAKKTFHVWKID